MRDEFDRRRYLEIIKIGPHKDIARVLGSRFQRQIDLNTGVEADAAR